MRLIPIAAAVCIVSMSGPAFAQEWIDYVNREERFRVNLPGQPTVIETTYEPQRGATLRARVFTVQDGPRHFSVAVVNFAGADPTDVRGSIAWEAWNFRKRGGEITYDAFAQVDRVEGHMLHITNPDGTLTYVSIHLHARRLYILEATGPPNSPGAMHFQQSLGIIDEAGNRIRYELDDDGNRSGRILDLDGIC